MNLKTNLMLRQVADTWIVIPLGREVLSFDGMLKLNESGVLLWKALENGASKEKLVDILIAEYAIDQVSAMTDVETFLKSLIESGCLEQ